MARTSEIEIPEFQRAILQDKRGRLITASRHTSRYWETNSDAAPEKDENDVLCQKDIGLVFFIKHLQAEEKYTMRVRWRY
jgi:hypothetical protein